MPKIKTSTAEPVLRLEYLDPAELTANPLNWRTHPESQKRALKDAIAEVGWAGALLYNERTKRLIDGHARKDEFAGEKVPVLIGSWTEAQERQILATLDPLAAMAGTDAEKLGALLKEFHTDSQAIQAMLGDLADEAGIDEPAKDKLDDVAPIDQAGELQKKWRTKTGQLWLIPSKSLNGRSHRLLCGDSTSAADVERVMGGKKVALVATDPPYLVDYTGERPNDSGKDWTGTYHEIDIKDANGFFRAVFTNVLAVLDDNAAIYCWHAHKRSGEIQSIWRELGILDHQQIVWVKPTPVFGRVYWHFRHEPCMLGWKQGSKPEHNGQHEHDSVWEVDWEGKQRIVGNDHPTQKPVELFLRPMRKHTKRGDVVFEPFSGSGSQLVAAEHLGRSCCALEIEPAFVAVALERLANLGLAPRMES